MTLIQTTTTTREQRMRIPVPQVEPRVAIPLQNLRIPGPTPVPPAVLAELAHPVTPPVSLFFALDLALELLLAEGLDAIFARHQHLGEYVRRHVRAIGLHLLADPAHASNTVTAVHVPDGIDAKVLLNTLRERDNMVLAGGQEHLSGKLFRIGHMGCCEVRDLFTALNCLQVRLQELGFRVGKQNERGVSQW